MSGFLKQSTAVTVKLGPFVDDTDGKTAETALTILQADVRLSKNGGNMAQKNESTAASHDEIGIYDCPLDTTDTNTLGILEVFVHESGALPIKHTFMVLPASMYDMFFGTTGPVPHLGILARGTAQAATGTMIQLASGESFADDAINGCVVLAHGSTQGYWQANVIDDYVSATDTATVPTWPVTPSGTITYIVLAAPLASAANPIPATVSAADIRAAIGLGSANLDTQLSGINTLATAIGGYLDTEIAAIKAKTDNLPSDPADQSVVAALIAAAEAKIDILDALADAIKAKTDSLTFTIANVLDANIQRINDKEVTGTGASGDKFNVAA